MDNLKVIKELANTNITILLDALDVKYRDRYVYLNGPCPIHNGDRKDAWSWSIDRGIWQCYSRGCHNDYDADIYGLVQGIKECGFLEAKNFIKKYVNCNLTNAEIKELRDARSNRDFVNYTRKRKRQEKIYNPKCLDRLEYHNYLENRGYSKKIVEKYQVGVGSPGKYMSDRIIFPIHNKIGEIVGFTGRTLLEDWHERGIPKWKHSKDYVSESNLFNILFAQEYIKKNNEAILVEGPLDVLKLEECGVHNSVAVLGKSLHNGQMTLLMGIPTFKLRIAFDADKAGISGAKEVFKKASSFFDVEIIKLPNNKDCGDLNIDEVRSIFNDKTCNI